MKKTRKRRPPLSQCWDRSRKQESLAHAQRVLQEFSDDFRTLRSYMKAGPKHIAGNMGVATDTHVRRIEAGENVTLITAIRAVAALDADLVLEIRRRENL